MMNSHMGGKMSKLETELEKLENNLRDGKYLTTNEYSNLVNLCQEHSTFIEPVTLLIKYGYDADAALLVRQGLSYWDKDEFALYNLANAYFIAKISSENERNK